MQQPELNITGMTNEDLLNKYSCYLQDYAGSITHMRYEDCAKIVVILKDLRGELIRRLDIHEGETATVQCPETYTVDDELTVNCWLNRGHSGNHVDYDGVWK